MPTISCHIYLCEIPMLRSFILILMTLQKTVVTVTLAGEQNGEWVSWNFRM